MAWRGGGHSASSRGPSTVCTLSFLSLFLPYSTSRWHTVRTCLPPVPPTVAHQPAGRRPLPWPAPLHTPFTHNLPPMVPARAPSAGHPPTSTPRLFQHCHLSRFRAPSSECVASARERSPSALDGVGPLVQRPQHRLKPPLVAEGGVPPPPHRHDAWRNTGRKRWIGRGAASACARVGGGVAGGVAASFFHQSPPVLAPLSHQCTHWWW